MSNGGVLQWQQKEQERLSSQNAQIVKEEIIQHLKTREIIPKDQKQLNTVNSVKNIQNIKKQNKLFLRRKENG